MTIKLDNKSYIDAFKKALNSKSGTIPIYVEYDDVKGKYFVLTDDKNVFDAWLVGWYNKDASAVGLMEDITFVINDELSYVEE